MSSVTRCCIECIDEDWGTARYETYQDARYVVQYISPLATHLAAGAKNFDSKVFRSLSHDDEKGPVLVVYIRVRGRITNHARWGHRSCIDDHVSEKVYMTDSSTSSEDGDGRNFGEKPDDVVRDTNPSVRRKISGMDLGRKYTEAGDYGKDHSNTTGYSHASEHAKDRLPRSFRDDMATIPRDEQDQNSAADYVAMSQSDIEASSRRVRFRQSKPRSALPPLKFTATPLIPTSNSHQPRTRSKLSEIKPSSLERDDRHDETTTPFTIESPASPDYMDDTLRTHVRRHGPVQPVHKNETDTFLPGTGRSKDPRTPGHSRSQSKDYEQAGSRDRVYTPEVDVAMSAAHPHSWSVDIDEMRIDLSRRPKREYSLPMVNGRPSDAGMRNTESPSLSRDHSRPACPPVSYREPSRQNRHISEPQDRSRPDLGINYSSQIAYGPRPLRSLPPNSMTQMLRDPSRLGTWADLVDDLRWFNVLDCHVSKVDICSMRLTSLLQSLFGTSYGNNSLLGDTISMHEPFPMMIHHFKDLEYMASSTYRDDRELFIDCCYDHEKSLYFLEQDTKAELKTLLDALEPWYNEVDLATSSFTTACDKTAWSVYKPSSLAYYRSHVGLEPVLCCIDGIEYEGFGANEDFELGVTLNVFRYCYIDGNLVKKYWGHEPQPGWKSIKLKDLKLVPAALIDKADGGRCRAENETRGRRFYEIISKQLPLHMEHTATNIKATTSRNESGNDVKLSDNRVDSLEAFRNHSLKQYSGEVMIDVEGYNTFSCKNTMAKFNSETEIEINEAGTKTSSDPWGSHKLGGIDLPRHMPEDTTALIGYSWKAKDRKMLSAWEWGLLPREIEGFKLKTKQWGRFAVEMLVDRPAEPKDTLSRIILPPGKLDILRAIASTQSHGWSSRWSLDFISGKGDGQIFLLHGPPGTGKTFTVECFAETTGKPLITLTVADIGTDERSMEENLSRWFMLASHWNAVLLIDEADVYLEKRHIDSLNRNGLVSVFLRCMEYYRGMLFLTTNRLGHIDDACLSRISIGLIYDTLSVANQLDIWEKFFNKVETEREREISINAGAKKYIRKKWGAGSSMCWNGREIRNAFQTALAMASHHRTRHDSYGQGRSGGGPIEVSKEHVKMVVNARQEFTDYRDSITNANIEFRAFMDATRAEPGGMIGSKKSDFLVNGVYGM